MRSLCWKELRENLKWALLAMAALGLGELYALYHTQSDQPDYFYNTGITLCKTEFLVVTTFGSAAAGCLLGLLQILPERRRDQWATLLHRPVTRGSIFLGKVLAGLLLYALATVPPFLLSVWLVATPGHFSSPFVPGMVRPGVADLCAGVVYYFAALALAWQRDKWKGLWVFPIFAAFHCSCFVLSTDLFYVAIEAAALMSLALFATGLGTLLHPGKLAERSWPCKAAFLAMVFYGACGLGDVAKSGFKAVEPAVHSRSVRYELSDKGVPLRITEDDGVCVSVNGVDGKPLAGKEYQPSEIQHHLSYLPSFSLLIGDTHGWTEPSEGHSYRVSSAYLRALTFYSYPRLEQWFYVSDQKSLVGYALIQKTAFARFDQHGVQPVLGKPRPFFPETRWNFFNADHLIFWNGKSLSYVSLPKRESVDLSLPYSGPLFGIGTANSQGAGKSVSVFGAVQLNGLAIYDTKGALVTILPYHHDVDRWGNLAMGLNGAMDRFYLWYYPSNWIDYNTRRSLPSYLEEMNRQGEVLQTWTLPPLPPYFKARSWGDFFAERLQSPAFFFGSMADQKLGALLGSGRLRDILAKRLQSERSLTKEIALAITTLSFALAGVTLFWARRVYFSWVRALAWAVFVFAFNAAGFIAFRLAADWPSLVPCPQCRRVRPVHDDLCPLCTASWPAAPTEGTEIFDNAAADLPAGAGD